MIGQTFKNDGSSRLHARGFNWGETLTVVRQDRQAYGTTRYVVKDRHGRNGYAF